MSNLNRLYATDETFREVADILFGEGGDQIVKKLSPQEKQRQRRQAQVGLASNVVGIGAGVAGTAAALRDDRFKEGGKLARKIYAAGQKIPKPISSKAGRTGAYLAGGALGLQVANIGGDVVANRVLARSAKKDKVKKSSPDKSDLHSAKGAFKLIPPINKVPVGGNKKGKKYAEAMSKSVTWEGEISKIDTDKRQVFGWASIVEVGGQPVVDLQGDYIDIDEIEKSAYEYVIKSRKGGNMHERDGEGPRHVSDMIESFLVTPEKIEKMGLPKDTPLGWWVGYQINDDSTWAEVKSGRRTGFSIHGRGMRTPVEM